MPKSDLTSNHFALERKEWTKRKHQLLERYVVPAAQKLKQLTGQVALIDGYAGANAYGTEVIGSTVIMAKAAKAVRNSGALCTVYACEQDAPRLLSLQTSLSGEIAENLVVVYRSLHRDALSDIALKIGANPAFVFLDPQTSSELTLDHDIRPWASRAKTDVMGVFMGGDACRVVASAVAENRESMNMLQSLGPGWRTATSEDAAYNVFFEQIRGLKKYACLYRLRKQERKRDAYGIFALSDSPHGLWLMSDAVARDWGTLLHAQAAGQASLFEAEEHSDNLDELVKLCNEAVPDCSRLRSQELAVELVKRGYADEIFGRYRERDFTEALKVLREGKQHHG